MGHYFEDFEAGQRLVTPGRTLTEADIVLFAGLSGDHNPIHTDVEFCRGTPYERPIAHGLLTLAVLSGLIERTGLQEGTIVALRRMRALEFHKPVFAGDTLRGELEVLEKVPRQDLGRVTFGLKGLNQRAETVLYVTYEALFKCRTDQGGQGP